MHVQFDRQVGGGQVTSFWHQSKSRKSRKTLCGIKIEKGASFKADRPDSDSCPSCQLIAEGADPVWGPFQHGRKLLQRVGMAAD